MSNYDPAFREMLAKCIDIVVARKPPQVTDVERLFLSYMVGEDEAGRL